MYICVNCSQTWSVLFSCSSGSQRGGRDPPLVISDTFLKFRYFFVGVENRMVCQFKIIHILPFLAGFYLTAMTTNSTNPKKAQLLTPEITSDTEMCVRFW